MEKAAKRWYTKGTGTFVYRGGEGMGGGGKTILVVDDEPKIVDVVQSYLEKSGYRVIAASTGRQALEAYEARRPHLLILDWMLPDIPGEEVCRRIRETSDVPVILLTARAGEENILEGFTFGADDYVTKPFSPRQLVARVEAVLRRTHTDATRALSFGGGDLVIDTTGHAVAKAGRPANLTPNEFQILALLAQRPKKVFTREELISFMERDPFEGYSRVIDTHIKNIRQKIETDPKNPRYILTVHGVGYRFGGS